ncbi:uncharacterized protein LOC119076981 [Bradysia coprophila]|uniref:uncharacterized protein LOC119076981 n=1 Tax=Bradysia coprophila TaxID=38358 RepID=UPI00187DAB28|nr:uncharacterized protein LOC119076981 [Bradysia coprophila]
MADENYRKVSAFRCCLCPHPKKPNSENLLDSKLLRCQNCKLISYCGLDHQKNHWPAHKEFCRAIASITSEMKVKHIIDINGSAAELTALQLREVKFMIQTLMVVKLHRELTEGERELIWFPRICSFCNSHEGALMPCPECFAVGYCCEEHRVEDMDTHLRICAELHLCYNFSLDELPEDEVQFIPVPATDVSFPKDLFEMHRMSTAFLNKDHTQDFLGVTYPTTSKEYQNFANICNLSNVATVLHALNQIQDYKSMVTSILTIHIVGANTEIALFTRYECWLLFYWLPTIFYINLVFIGPELPTKNGFTEISYKSNRKKTVKVTYKKMKYEEFATTIDTEPDLIVSLNCGFAEHENGQNNPWREAIAVMLKYSNTPIVFTSYTKTEAIADMKVVRKVADEADCKFKIICDGELNLFRDNRPLRNFIGYKTDAIYYYNGYLSVILTHKDEINF